MRKIKVDDLISDVVERMDDFAILNNLPNAIRQKKTALNRVVFAINQAIIQFCRERNPAALVGYVENVDLIEDEGASNAEYKVYNWPANAVESREDGGLVVLLLDGEDFRWVPQGDVNLIQSDIESIKQQARNTLMYGPGTRNAAVDVISKRIYVPADVTVEARIITKPDIIEDDDGSWEPAELEIDEAYQEELAARATRQLVDNIASLTGGQPVKKEA